ncbi:MAG: glutamate--tRNA ligase [bacterium]|nr:glutamate--tRNA ligase [bacterium]
MIRVRVAPSPTGNLHIGNAQSALYNWLFAKKRKGKFLLRIEDTDKERSTKEFEQNIYDSLKWLDLKPDESPVIQSANLFRHKEMLNKLLVESKAFYCHHAQEELEIERKRQEKDKEAPRHICGHKNTNKGKEASGIIRLLVDEKSDRKISFDDQIRGKVEFKANLLGDFSIARSIENPLYHFAVVVDDIDMEITHVIRGEDHISNTPKQILIYEALGKTPPKFAHLSLILAPDRSKLSKRHGGTAIIDYQKDYLPEAMLNFLGGLGYTFSKEILTKEEMIEEFELEKVHKSGAVFDIKKLNWLNSQYIKKLSPKEFKKLANVPDLPDEAVPLVTERLEKLSDVQSFDYFWKEPEYNKELLKWKKSDLPKSLETITEVKKIIEDFNFEKGKDELRKTLDEFSVKVGDPSTSSGQGRGLVYWPLRVALTGKEKSPDPVDIAFVLGKQKVIERINKALGK